MEDTTADGRGPDEVSVVAVLAFTPDLLDRSKVAAAAGEGVRFVGRPEDLSDPGVDPAVVVADLTRPGVLDAVTAMEPSRRARCVVYANHTRRDLMDAAEAAGCAQVLARSQFFGNLGVHLGLGGGS